MLTELDKICSKYLLAAVKILSRNSVLFVFWSACDFLTAIAIASRDMELPTLQFFAILLSFHREVKVDIDRYHFFIIIIIAPKAQI